MKPGEQLAPGKARKAVADERKRAEAQLPAGRVGRAHGLDGSFYVTHARARLLTVGTDVTIAGRAAAIVRRAGSEERPIVRIHGIEDRAAAQQLRGQELTVPLRDAPQLAAGEWWAHELEGCAVFDRERRIGTVIRMIELPSCEALEVQVERASPVGSSQRGHSRNPAPPASLLMPMVKDAIRSVDVAAGVIDVNMEFIEQERWT